MNLTPFLAFLVNLTPFLDSIMLTTAQAHGAAFWTQDADFERSEGVRCPVRSPEIALTSTTFGP